MTADWQSRGLWTALRKGSSKHGRSGTKVVFDGEARCVGTFEGMYWTASGRLMFWHCSSKVMEVDFDRDLITDFGYSGYTHTTTRYINGWLWNLQRARILGVPSLDGSLRPFDWTWSYRYNGNEKFSGKGYHEDMHDRFRRGAPWVVWIGEMPWFHGARWDFALNVQYGSMRREILFDQGWRWWTADWDDKHQWVKRFVDADAERRWNAREKRHARANTERWAKGNYTMEELSALQEARVEAGAS